MNLLSKCKEAYDELSSALFSAFSINCYIYPTPREFQVSGFFKEKPDSDVLKQICEYVAEERDASYSGPWSSEELYSLLKNELEKAKVGSRYWVSLDFGGASPALAVLSYLSVYSSICSLKANFYRDKWEERGDYISSDNVGIVIENDNLKVDIILNPDHPSNRKKFDIKTDGYKSDEILYRDDMFSTWYDVRKVRTKKTTVNKYKVELRDRTHTVLEQNGYFFCDCNDFETKPQNCRHIVAVKRFLNDPFVLWKAANFRIAAYNFNGVSTDEKHSYYIDELKKAYKGVKVYSLGHIRNEQHFIPFEGIKSWIKSKFGITAYEYFKFIGIISPETSYELVEKKITPNSLTGKKCCVLLNNLGIDNFEQILSLFGAEIVSSDSDDIDYLFIDVNIPLIKEPPIDSEKEITMLLKRRDDGEINFDIVSNSFVLENLGQILKMNDEINRKHTDACPTVDNSLHDKTKLCYPTAEEIKQNLEHWVIQKGILAREASQKAREEEERAKIIPEIIETSQKAYEKKLEDKLREREEKALEKSRELANQKAKAESEKIQQKELKEATYEELISSLVANYKDSSPLEYEETVAILDESVSSMRDFKEYISEKYDKALKPFLEELGILKTVRSEFDNLIEMLKQRYESKPKVSEITVLTSENADLDISLIVNSTKKFTGMTAREYLLKTGILVEESVLKSEDLFDGVIYKPGNEPDNIKKRLSTLFEKLDGAYPDKVISGLNREHKKWGETVTELYRILGYANNKNFLMAYGYTVADNKGGRTANNDEELISELQRRYPNGSPYTSVKELMNANPELSHKLRSLYNTAPSKFGMTLTKYLIEQNILASK